MPNIPAPKGEEIRIVFIDTESGKVIQETGIARQAGGTVNNKVADILNNTDTLFSYIGKDGMENLVEKADILTVMPTKVKPKLEMKLKEIGVSIKMRYYKDTINGIINIGEFTLQQVFERKTFIPIITEVKGTEGQEHRLLLINKKHRVGKVSTVRY